MLFILTDTYSCARALKHALKNPLLLTNAKKSSQLVTSTTPTTPQVLQYLKKTVKLMFNVHPHTLSLSLSSPQQNNITTYQQ